MALVILMSFVYKKKKKKNFYGFRANVIDYNMLRFLLKDKI